MLSALLRLFTFRRVAAGALRLEPVALAGLWLLGTAALAALTYLALDWPWGLIDAFVFLAMQVLSALAVAGLLGSWDDVPDYASAFVALGLAALVVPLFAYRAWPDGPPGDVWERLAGLWAVLAAIRFIAGSATQTTPLRRLAAMAVVAVLFPLGANLTRTEAALAERIEPVSSVPTRPKVDHEALWGAQPELLAQALAVLPPATGSAPRVYSLAIAAGGSQALFGREAQAVSALFARRLNQTAPGPVLSNAAADSARLPLASRANLAAALSAIGRRFDPARDTALVYLTAHGGPDASLQTDLPDSTDLRPITAAFLADAFKRTGINRRIVIVSACYSGSWIAPLASPDTIVLTASAANRTSFGCDDRRRYTFFGTALLGGALSKGASLREAFTRLRSDIGKAEAELGLTPSLPEASVGSRMQATWNAPLGR